MHAGSTKNNNTLCKKQCIYNFHEKKQQSCKSTHIMSFHAEKYSRLDIFRDE